MAAACLLLLPFVGGAVWSALRTRSERQAEVRGEAGSLAVTTAAYLDQYFAGLDSLASLLVRYPPVSGMKPDEARQLFATVSSEQPLLLDIVLATADGQVVAAAAAPTVAKRDGPPPSYVQQVVAGGSRIVSPLLTGWSTGPPAVVFAYPVWNDAGVVAGVLGLGVNLVRLQGVFAGIPLPAGSVVTLADRDGRILTRSRDAERTIGTSADVTDGASLPSEGLRTGADGVQRFFGNARLTRAPWVLTVGIPRSVVAARVLPLWRRNVVMAVLAVAGSLLLALWLAQVMSVHLNRLRSAAQRIAAGDLSPPRIDVVPNLELAQLRDAFVAMAAGLLQTRTALDQQVEQERKMNEALQSLRRQVVRQERLAAVGVLVSGVAHEL